MNFYVNKNNQPVKKPEMVGLLVINGGDGQKDTHGYSYGYARLQMQELGETMGLDKIMEEKKE